MSLAIGSFTIVRRLLEPYAEFLRFIPATALIAVAVISFGNWRGFEDLPDHLRQRCSSSSSTRSRIAAVAPDKIRAARSLGAGRAQVFFFVALPATMPLYILWVDRLAMADSFVTPIVAGSVAANDSLGRDDLGIRDLHARRPDLRRLAVRAGSA